MALAGTPLFYAPEEQFRWEDALHLETESYPCPHVLSEISPEFPFPPPTEYDIHGPRPRPFAFFKPKPLIGSPLRTSPSSHSRAAETIQALHTNGEPLSRIRHSRQMIGFLTKYCLAQDQTLLNGPPHLNHPAFQPDAHPPSSWSDFNAHHGTIPNAADQARALDQLRDLYIIQSGRSPVIVNGEPAITIQVYTQICEPINIMLKMRYGQDANLWNTDRPWILPPGHELPGSAHPQWSPAVFNSRKFGTQSQLLGKTEQAGDSDGILSATLVDHPAFMEVKTWWSVSRPDLMAEFRQIANVGGGFYWGSSSQTDNAAVSLMKQMWGEFHSYQSRLGVFMNGQDIAFVIRTRRNELTFSEFMNWDSREVYTAFLGFSMVAVDAVLSGPADGYQERLRDIINTICPHEDREIRPDHHDHPGDDNDDDAGDEMWDVTD